jgi:D-glycero-D-manno-heptose 1,7-bisphosphate phosphatase
VGSLSRRAVFLDRDGTLNVRPAEHAYLTSADEFEWLDGAVEALARLARGGFVLAVVSNQRGVARGLVTQEVLAEIERRMQEDLAAHGCRIEAFSYCPHDIEDRCGCRKPEPGMLLDVAEQLDLDLARSWMVGDTAADVQAGRAAGCRTALVAVAPGTATADVVVSTLDEASRLIVASAAGH